MRAYNHTHLVDPKVKRFLKWYVLQSFLAAVVLFVILFIEDAPGRGAIIAAIGSTAFILFMMPDRSAANPRHVLGGHFIGLAIGGAIAAFNATSVGQDLLAQMPILLNMEAGVAVGLAMFLMVATESAHAPAAGTALGMVLHPFSWGIVALVVTSVVALSVAHWLLHPKLHNLL